MVSPRREWWVVANRAVEKHGCVWRCCYPRASPRSGSRGRTGASEPPVLRPSDSGVRVDGLPGPAAGRRGGVDRLWVILECPAWVLSPCGCGRLERPVLPLVKWAAKWTLSANVNKISLVNVCTGAWVDARRWAGWGWMVLGRVAVRSDVHNEKTRLRPSPRAALAWHHRPLASRRRSLRRIHYPIIPDPIRGVELVEASAKRFCTHCAGSARTRARVRSAEGRRSIGEFDVQTIWPGIAKSGSADRAAGESLPRRTLAGSRRILTSPVFPSGNRIPPMPSRLQRTHP